MKKIIFILATATLLVACGEKENNGNENGNENGNGGTTELTLEQKLLGEWHSTMLVLEADIYLSFAENKTFEIYQQIEEGAHRLYRGTWNLEDNLLTGKYNDGEDWAASYLLTIHDKILTLVSNNDAAEESVFAKEEIPAEIKETCETIVKSKAL